MKYVLDSDDERQRLELQGKLVDPHTRRLLEMASMGEGKSLLDVGAGAGDTSLLAAQLAGRSGRVVGVDIEADMVEYARKRAEAKGIAQVSFQSVSDTLDEVDERFDLVFARFVLLFQTNKVALLRRMAQLVRPGGAMVLVESSWTLPSFWSEPPLAAYDEYMERLASTIKAIGIDNNVGPALGPLFAEAGLGEPEILTEVITGGKTAGLVDYILACGQVVFSRAKAASVSAITETDLAQEHQQIMAVVQNGCHQFVGPCLVGAFLKL